MAVAQLRCDAGRRRRRTRSSGSCAILTSIVSEARVHVPTFLNILGASIPLPGRDVARRGGAAQGRRLHGGRGDGRRTRPRSAPDDTLEDVATQMHEREVSHLPVVDGDGVWSGSSRAATSSGSSPGPRDRRGPEMRTGRSGPRSTSDAIAANVAHLRDAAVATGRAARGREGRRLRPRRGPVSRAALGAGASRARASRSSRKVSQLREAGIDAPVLVLSEPVPEAADDRRRAPADAGRVHGRRHRGAREGGRPRPKRADPLDVHLKIDTGMHRVGCRTRTTRSELARQIVAHPELRLAGTCTHFAVADEPARPVHRGTARALRQPSSPSCAGPGHRARHRARVQHGGHDRVPERALRHGARRYRRVRHRPCTRARRACPAATGALGQAPGCRS